MAFVGSGAILLDYDSEGAAATAQTETYTITSTDNSPADQVFYLFGTLTQSGGATSPVASLVVEQSVDGSTWAPAVAIDTDGTDESASITPVSVQMTKHLRVRLTVGGATAPAVVANVQLASDASFTATEV